jgi:hypothetical protein
VSGHVLVNFVSYAAGPKTTGETAGKIDVGFEPSGLLYC